MNLSKPEKRKNRIHMVVFSAVFFFLAAFILSSCRGLELENKTEIVEEYTLPQAMILIANARNRYENLYTDAIWSITVGTDGSTFDRLIVQDIKEYLERIKLICLLAEEKGTTLTATEREAARQMAEQYMSLLSDADREYIGCESVDAEKMYQDILEADKLLKSITADVDSDFSDSEAKVIRIEQIVTEDETKAKAILKRVKIDGANFSSMAARYNESDETEITLLKNEDEGGLIAATAFSLEEGEISNILCVDGLYYIIRCMDDYAEEETLTRKQKLEQAMNTKAVEDVLLPYAAEHNIQFVERFWTGIDFSEPTDSTVQNFFDIFNNWT